MESVKIPTEIQTFRQLVTEGFLFVDKSLLIRDILNNGMKKILITRPRRFGKTLALSMIDRFFNIKYSDEESTEDSFNGLKIESCSEYDTWVKKGYRNGFPVIRLDMSTLEFNSLESFKSALTNKIRYLLNVEFGYILDSEKVPDYLKRYIMSDESGTSLGLGESMSRLCTAISIHHGVKPIVLIDEYDSPINCSLNENWSDELTTIYGDFLKITTKACEDTSMVIITGVQKFITRGLYSSLNNMRHMSVISGSFGEYFGITPDEMMALISFCVERRYGQLSLTERKAISDQKYRDAAQWYDGYNICGSDVFNPWSSMNYLALNVLNDGPLMMYWNDTAENEALVTLFSHASESILSTIKEAYISGETIAINRLSQNSPILKDKNAIDGDELLNTLLSTGYLTLDKNDSSLAKIPNNEVRNSFNTLMTRVFCLNLPDIIGLLDHIRDQDPKAVKEDLESLMEGGSYLDGWSEMRYKSWLHDLFSIYGYRSITERESGEGRTDLFIERYGNKPPIVFELKVVDPDSQEDLERVATMGLHQIMMKRYVSMPSMRGSIALSVAFRKKTCAVRFL